MAPHDLDYVHPPLTPYNFLLTTPSNFEGMKRDNFLPVQNQHSIVITSLERFEALLNGGPPRHNSLILETNFNFFQFCPPQGVYFTEDIE